MLSSTFSVSCISGCLTSRLEAEERRRGGVWIELKDINSCEQLYDDGLYDDDDDNENSILIRSREMKPQSNAVKLSKETINEHPMRTDEWLISVSLSPFIISKKRETLLFPISFSSRRKNARQRDQYFKFANNGYVLMVESDGIPEENHFRSQKQVTRVGKWNICTNGISWTVPISVGSDPNHQTCLHYHADIHLSKFQDRPRMFRGVVTRDRYVGAKIPFTNISIGKSCLRPVIATFVGSGVGADTADMSYKKRGFGLAGGNA